MKNKKTIIKFTLIFAVFFILVFAGIKFLPNFLKQKKEKEELITVLPSQPQQEIKEIKKEPTPEEKIAQLESELKKEPENVSNRAILAYLYFQVGNIASALLEYKKIIEISPKSKEAKDARDWLQQQQNVALSEWKDTFGKKFQEPILLGQYGSITLQLQAITQQKELTPTASLSPTTDTISKPTSLTPPLSMIPTQPYTYTGITSYVPTPYVPAPGQIPQPYIIYPYYSPPAVTQPPMYK